MNTQDKLAYGVLIAAVVLVITLIASPAAPSTIRPDLEPPAKFLVDPGNVEIDVQTSPFAPETCSWLTNTEHAQACAIMPSGTKSGRCLIIIPTPRMKFGKEPWISLLMRHEVAHCYGWRH
jgi:hypothetical protein